MVLLRKVEEIARDVPQDHLLDPIEIDEVVFEGDADALDEGLRGVVSEELMEAPHGSDGLAAMANSEAVDERPQHLVLSAQLALFWARPSRCGPAGMRPVLGLGDPLACSRWTLLVLADHLVPLEDLDLFQILANTQASPDEVSVGGYGVSIRVERDVAFDIHVPLVEVIDLGDVDR